ncbi:hypothetical protein Dimus_032416 [Dionaea muscipula]
MEFSMEVFKTVLQTVSLCPRLFEWSYLQGWILKVTRGVTQRTIRRKQLFAGVVYGIWMERNRRIFQQTENAPSVLASMILNSV